VFFAAHDRDESQCRGVVGKDSNHDGSSLGLGVQPFKRVRRPELLPVGNRKVSKRGDILGAVRQYLFGLRIPLCIVAPTSLS